MKNAFEVIIAPVLTEKTNALIQEKKYTFRVAPGAGKIEIAKASSGAIGSAPSV